MQIIWMVMVTLVLALSGVRGEITLVWRSCRFALGWACRWSEPDPARGSPDEAIA